MLFDGSGSAGYLILRIPRLLWDVDWARNPVSFNASPAKQVIQDSAKCESFFQRELQGRFSLSEAYDDLLYLHGFLPF